MGEHQINREELIKVEMNLLQSRFDKYDDLIFRSRNWFLTIWVAIMGITFTSKVAVLPFLAAGMSVLYWILEGLLRHQYWYKYVERYRRIRDELNKPDPDLDSLSVYDLTNKYSSAPDEKASKIVGSFFKIETVVFYVSMALLGITMGVLFMKDIIPL